MVQNWHSSAALAADCQLFSHVQRHPNPSPPFMANAILNFHFDFLTTSLTSSTWPQLLSDISAGISIFFSSSPGTSRAEGPPSQYYYTILLYQSLICWYPRPPEYNVLISWIRECPRSTHQEAILPIYQMKLYSIFSGLNEIALVNNFPYIMWLTR